VAAELPFFCDLDTYSQIMICTELKIAEFM
jgi:hypothetical protein